MLKDRSFLDADIREVLSKLTLEEKTKLLSAPDWWNTHPIPRLGIPAVRMSDGPNGIRGSSHFIPTPAQCLPCATALASTFDPELVHRVGEFLGAEAKVKSSVILLAPTCNIPRSPLGGRSFESFSEDPHLSGVMSAAYVNGLQSQGVSATIKHFVANDQEHERTAVDSVMSERALREVYLYPFMLAQKLAKPWAFMTAYGRIDGIHCSENPRLLRDILRGEWGFEGVIISDWYGTYSVDLAMKAGMDLEMPGPPRWRTTTLVNQCLSSQKLHVKDIEDRAEKLLIFVQKLAKANPDVVYGDGVERSRDSPELRQFCRRLTSETMVLLKNRDNVLPLRRENVRKVALIGPHLKTAVISGGGSAALKPTYVVTPFDGITSGAPDGMQFSYALGCYAHRYLPTIESLLTTPSGERGWLCSFYNVDANGEPIGDAVAEFVLNDTRVKLNDFIPAGLKDEWIIKITGRLTVEKTMPFELGLAVAGRAKLFINDELTIDNWTSQTPGDFFYGQGTDEVKATINLTANQPVNVLCVYSNISAMEKSMSQPALMRGLRLGGVEKIDEDMSIKEAADLAANSDVAIVVVGLTSEWESEGFDRPTLQLPRRQDDLITRVMRANTKTIVVIQAGSPVSMPWVGGVGGILQAWLSGNEAGNAIADILFGKVNPSGKLPLTFPCRIEDNPSYLSFGSENGKVHYREDVFVGYKWYQARLIKPLFPFGYGLSYTRFKLSNLTLSRPSTSDEAFSIELSVDVTNTGSLLGSEVVQLYVSLPPNGVTTPHHQLRGIAKAKNVPPGRTRTVTIKLDKYAVSFWDTPNNSWSVVSGTYGVHIGTNSEEFVLGSSFEVERSFHWNGI